MAFPVDQETPVFMVGPGAGLAPFISYLEEREALGGMKRHNNYVYTGNRSKEMDFLHGEYLENLRGKEWYFLFSLLILASL